MITVIFIRFSIILDYLFAALSHKTQWLTSLLSNANKVLRTREQQYKIILPSKKN